MKKIFTLFLIAISSLAKGQTACDSLDINVHYYPFNDSIIQVNVYNNSSAFFGYPVFTIFDTNGDTVALEQMNFFGIAQESRHALNVHPANLSGNAFSGTLTLYHQTVDSYAVCTWPMNFDLCPDTCYTVYPYLMNIGGAQVYGDASWSILNSNSQVVASGVFSVDTNTQSAYDTVCLDPGIYSFKVNDISLTLGGNKHIGLSTQFINAANPDTAFNNQDSVSLGFQFFGACPSTTSVKSNDQTAEASIHSFANSIYINNTGQPIGEISIYAIDGKKVFAANTQNTFQTISLNGVGIYIVRVKNKTGTTVKKVYIEQ